MGAAATQTITPFLWFADQAEDAAKFYVSIFENSKIGRIARYGSEGHEIHGRKAGSVMTVEFELQGQSFTALNGGPAFQFNEAISFVIHCKTQAEVDHHWNQLGAGGDPGAQQSGWLKDKFGVSWQVVPDAMIEWLTNADPERARRVTAAMLQMKKLDIAGLKRAYDGG